jgi:hypothetical protein
MGSKIITPSNANHSTCCHQTTDKSKQTRQIQRQPEDPTKQTCTDSKYKHKQTNVTIQRHLEDQATTKKNQNQTPPASKLQQAKDQ